MINIHKIAKTLRQALPWALVIFALLFAYQKWQGEKRAGQNIATLQSEMKTYKNKIGSLTATVGTLQLTKRELEESILKKKDTINKLIEEFSSINTIVVTETIVKIDSIPVPFEVPVPFDFTRAGSKIEKWYSFNYEVDQNGLSLTNFQTWTETTTITGFKRKWFLGRQYAITDVTHSNPLITTTQIQAIEVVVPVKWHETRMFNLGLGILTGAIIFGK